MERELTEPMLLVFIGCRFPPPDAHARENMLEAVMDNDRRRPSVHIVLGPQEGDKDRARLSDMLRAVLTAAGRTEVLLADPWFTVASHGMWAEDFMSVFKCKQLFG